MSETPLIIPLVKPAGANHGWKLASVFAIAAAAKPENGTQQKSSKVLSNTFTQLP